MFEKLGGRKSVGLLILLIIGVTYAALRNDIPDNLLMLLLGSFSVFAGGNVAEHFAAATRAKRGRPPEMKVKVEAADIEKALAPLEQKLNAVSNQQLADSQTVNQVASIIVALASQPQQGPGNGQQG